MDRKWIVMKIRMDQVLIVIAGVLTLTISSFAMAALEIDGMPIDISQADFLKKRPEARTLPIPQVEYQSYFYVPKNYSLSGFTASSLSNIFVKGKGCAAIVAFVRLYPSSRKKLVGAIQLRHPKKTGEEEFVMTNGMLLYFEDSEAYASVFLEDKSDTGPGSLSYVVSLKSCGPDLARKLQALPRR